MIRCGCCGKRVEAAPAIDEIIVAAGLGQKHALLLEILHDAGGRWINSEKIGQRYYADDPHGGPLNTKIRIHHQIATLKAKLKVAMPRLVIESSVFGSRLVMRTQEETKGITNANRYQFGRQRNAA